MLWSIATYGIVSKGIESIATIILFFPPPPTTFLQHPCWGKVYEIDVGAGGVPGEQVPLYRQHTPNFSPIAIT